MPSAIPTEKRLAGFLAKIEHRTIGPSTSKKYWFVLTDDSPFLYWYKNETDITSLGRISLSGAAFVFDPREPTKFEIHSHGEVHVLQCLDGKSRSKWLQYLQANRRKHYERENVDDILNEVMSITSHSNLAKLGEQSPLNAVDASTLPDSATSSSTMSPIPGTSGAEFVSDTRFYINADGELYPTSLDNPPPLSPNRDLIKSAEELLFKIADETQSKAHKLEEPAKKAIDRARRSIKLPSFSSNSKANNQCENCKDLTKILEELKDRCYELTDEVSANQDLVCALRNESLLTSLQLNVYELRRELNATKEREQKKDAELQKCEAALEAFRESVKTKDEIIMKMWEDHESLEQRSRERAVTVTEAIDIGIPEGIPVDGGTPTEDATRELLDELAVDDVNQLKDLVVGYQSQNHFLNDEVLQLQKIVESLEERERKIIRQNFEIEACFYQLKSRYMMVLNHFRSGFEEAKKKLGPEVIQELLEDVSRPLKFQHREDSVSPRRQSLSIVLNSVAEGAQTDALGFYLHSPTPVETPMSPDEASNDSSKSQDEIMDKAAELKILSDQIVKNIQTEQSKQYLEWLQKWDCFLVNHMSNQTLTSNIELKTLVRQGIPHTYRGRVWKSLVQIVVANAQADSGKNYYQCLVKKGESIENPATDPSLRQIDLDLSRTLPTNIHFNTQDSDKMSQLKRVLYSFRFHNKSVEYCQGLNRIAAVALLYLKEDDAFWFLVAVVEYLQPPEYYTSTLKGAVIDQKVLIDIVQEKVPKVWNHLKNLDVDLSIFTLPWFLTIFVDVLNHELYLHIFDAFLLEGNKVIFRFAIALLKLIEPKLLECPTIGAVHSCLSNLMSLKLEPKELARVAFGIHSFPMKPIESRRQMYANLQQQNGARK
uniref:TBC1 domain family member 2B n=1 Tax=Panagrolaimus sp. PS1159 TaxID=55785 RepID=A0AC35FTC2_9BILA